MKAIEFNGDGKDEDEVCVKGIYHLDGCSGMSDYTICGITLDSDPLTAGSFNFVRTKAITCPTCVSIIKHCRGKRVLDT